MVATALLTSPPPRTDRSNVFTRWRPCHNLTHSSLGGGARESAAVPYYDVTVKLVLVARVALVKLTFRSVLKFILECYISAILEYMV